MVNNTRFHDHETPRGELEETSQGQSSVLLEFFKALADENRLKIVGVLAQKPRSVQDLSETLGLSASTTSHHLSRLAKSGLVTARAEGHYYFYSLQSDTLKKFSQQLLREDNLHSLAQGVTPDLFERKVMSAFLDPSGRIIAFPSQEKKFLVLLRYVVKAFESGRRYSEQEVNEILSRFNDDTASLRRGLVSFKMMGREGGGGAYWRVD